MANRFCFLVFFLLLNSSLGIAVDPLLKNPDLSSFEKIISQREIAIKVRETAEMIDRDLKSKGIEEIVLVAIMKGAICVTADLMRALKTPHTLELIQTKSYGLRGTSRGELTITGLDNLNLEGKHVLVTDDIFDSGTTLSTVVNKIKEFPVKSVHSLVFLYKHAPYQVDYHPDYSLFEIDNRFVVGYGMDYKEYWRGLPDVLSLPQRHPTPQDPKTKK